jgi:nitrate reductase molybdenum cofactor assembly chaperone NarJ/NarW
MNIFSLLSKAFCYPGPGGFEQLELMSMELPPGPVGDAFQSFLDQIRPLSLGEWEELYTRTWDLSPLSAPYIGFQIWGEDYRRGNFLAQLQRAYRNSAIDTGGELNDHLVPVLAYLAAVEHPIPELVEVFDRAIEKMTSILRKHDESNPYLHLLRATAAVGLRSPQATGGE